MPKVNVYLPDKLADAVKELEVPLSVTCQVALEREVSAALLARVPVARFTPRLRRLLAEAGAAAERDGRNFVGVEDVVLAVINNGENLPAHVIEELGHTQALRAGIHNAMRGRANKGSNRAGTKDAVYGWLVSGPAGHGVIRLDGTWVHKSTDKDGGAVFVDDAGEAVPPIPFGEAPYEVDVDDSGNPFVVVDAAGNHTGARSEVL